MERLLIRSALRVVHTLTNISSRGTPNENDLVVEKIQQEQYTVEKHSVETSDDYILTVHRILSKRRAPEQDKNETRKSKSVLLVHGFVTCGGQWIMYSKDSLGYKLADAGFDVWLLHVRGTSFSLKHKHLDSADKEFWQFSWDDFGCYDVPATIDYILDKTGDKNIFYVGHSQGCSVLMVTLAMKPEYNAKIVSACLLAPAVFVHLSNGFQQEFFLQIHDIMTSNKTFKMQFENTMFHQLVTFFSDKIITKRLLANGLQTISGAYTGQVTDAHNAPQMYIKYAINNFSYKQLTHVVQQIQQEKFQMYDYGVENEKIYGKTTPPEYDLTAVTIPIAVFYGEMDGLTPPLMVETLIKNLKNVQQKEKLPFNHFDFVAGSEFGCKVNDRVVEFFTKCLK